MAKKTYTVQHGVEGDSATNPGSPYGAYLLAVMVILFLCIIILTTTLFARQREGRRGTSLNEDTRDGKSFGDFLVGDDVVSQETTTKQQIVTSGSAVERTGSTTEKHISPDFTQNEETTEYLESTKDVTPASSSSTNLERFDGESDVIGTESELLVSGFVPSEQTLGLSEQSYLIYEVDSTDSTQVTKQKEETEVQRHSSTIKQTRTSVYVPETTDPSTNAFDIFIETSSISTETGAKVEWGSSSTTLRSTLDSTERTPTSYIFRSTTIGDLEVEGNANTANTFKQPQDTQTTEGSDDERSNREKETEPVCSNPDCKELVSRMLSLVDDSVDPCDDFYAFACGGIRRIDSIPEDDPSSDVWHRLSAAIESINATSAEPFRKFKTFYQSCLDYEAVAKEDRIKKVREIVESAGAMYDKSEWKEEYFNLTGLLVRMLNYHSSPLFNILLDVDGRNSSRFSLKLTTPRHNSFFRRDPGTQRCASNLEDSPEAIIDLTSTFKKYSRCKKDPRSYLNEIEHVLGELKIFHNGNGRADENIKRTRYIIDLYIMTAMERLPNKGQTRKAFVGKNFKEYTLEDIQRKYPLIDWQLLASELLGTRVDQGTMVQVYFEVFFDHLFAKLFDFLRSGLTDDPHSRLLHNSILGMFAHDMYEDFVISHGELDRQSYCLGLSSSLMEDVSSSMYLKTFGRNELLEFQQEITHLYVLLREVLLKELAESDWMDEPSRAGAVQKLKAMSLEADGGARIFLNETFLDFKSKEVNITASFIDNSLALVKRYQRMMFEEYFSDPADSQQIWSHFILPYHTQGIVIYGLNKIVIPFGTMTKSIYNKNFPKFILLSGLGDTIAHEMFHHFDPTGIRYDSSGVRRSFLSEVDSETYDVFHQCWMDPSLLQSEMSMDGNRTVKFRVKADLFLNERVADSSALKIGFAAHKKLQEKLQEENLPRFQMTKDQLYFLFQAQVHCTKSTILDYSISLFEDEHLPPFLRVNDFVSNFEDFAATFKCERGTRMNPQTKCNSFPFLESLDYEYYEQSSDS